MSKIDLTTLKSKFETGDRPQGADFVDLIDTLEDVTLVATKADASAVTALEGTVSTLTTTVSGKLDKSGGTMTGQLDMGGNSITGYKDKFYNGGTTGGAVTLSLSNGPLQKFTLGGAHAFTMPSASDGASFTLILIAGNAFVPTFTGVTNWVGTTSKATAPTLATATGNINVLTFFAESGSWYGFLSGTGV